MTLYCRKQFLMIILEGCSRGLIHTSNSSSSSSEAVSTSIWSASLVALGSGSDVSFLSSGSGLTTAVLCMSSDSHHPSGGGWTFSWSEAESGPETSLRMADVRRDSGEDLFVSSNHACSSNGATPLMYFAAWANDVCFRAPRSPEMPGKMVLNSIPIASILSKSFPRTQSFCLSWSRRVRWRNSRSFSSLSKGRSRWFVAAVNGSLDRYIFHFSGLNGAGSFVVRCSSKESVLAPLVSAILLPGLLRSASSIF